MMIPKVIDKRFRTQGYAEVKGVLFVGTYNGGLRRLNDDGWEVVSSLNQLIVWDLFVTPSGILIAGTYTGAYRSHDGGVTWEKEPRLHPPPIAFEMGEDGEIIAYTFSQGVYRSVDEGGTWTIRE